MTQTESCTFNVAKEYTRYPGGRFKIHGPYSGEEFRENKLLPLLNKCETVMVDLTGAVGYGSSFLDEAFGELGKIFGLEETTRRLIFISADDPALVNLIWDKIKTAAEER